MNKQAVLSLSGGMDSSTLLLHLLAESYEVTALSFDYGQKHRVELERAQALVNYINCHSRYEDEYYYPKIKYQIIKLDGLSQLISSALVTGGAEVPEGHYSEENMKATGKIISLQGELIGEGIQGNPYKIKGQTVRFFTGFDIDKYQRISFPELVVMLSDMGLQYVPILNQELGFVLPETVEDMLKYAEAKSVLNDKTEREGVVVRSMDGTISFKAISNKFLLNEK